MIETNEIITNDLKRKVEKIRNARKNLIDEVIKLLYSDVIFLNDKRIKDSFKNWLVNNNIFSHKIEITTKKRKKIILTKKETAEYCILSNLKFYEKEIMFYGSYSEKCPYRKSDYFHILELNGEIWLKYEIILNKIKNAIPGYLEHFYKKELLRLCDKKLVSICEKCGTKNEKCAIYCNICGKRIIDTY